MRHPAVPYLEALAGGVWWVIGAAALAAGTGTVILAAGLGVTGLLLVALRQRPAAPLPDASRSRLLQTVVGAVVLVAITGSLLGLTSFGELTVPVACVITGGALFPLASLLDERSLLAAGAVLLVLGAAGALLALGSAGGLYPRGVVGLGAGAVLGVTAVVRTGMLAEARDRVRR